MLARDDHLDDYSAAQRYIKARKALGSISPAIKQALVRHGDNLTKQPSGIDAVILDELEYLPPPAIEQISKRKQKHKQQNNP